jgi:hypothetical protein
MAIANGYPGKTGALSRTARELGISHQLLRNWVTASQNPPPQELLHEKTIDLRKMIHDEMAAIVSAMQGKRNDAPFMTLGTVFGILFDKSRLLDDMPTSITESRGTLDKLARLCAEHGLSASDALENFYHELAANVEQGGAE